MGGQVLGGGVIVLVAVALWLLYLLPSWSRRHRFMTAERNALRLNQALRVLAETSETPGEVTFELNTRTAFAQQRLARRAQAAREAEARKTQAEVDRAAQRAQAERDAYARKSQAERDEIAKQLLVESERAERERELAELERVRIERAAASARPEARRARARARARAMIIALWVLALACAALGAWDLLTTGSVLLLWVAATIAASTVLIGIRLARLRSRAVKHDAVGPVAVREYAEVQDVSLVDERAWSPRTLPKPLTASQGSQASAVLDEAHARGELRRAALEEAMRERAEQQRPVPLASVRTPAGDLDDAAIEAHCRELLQRRAAG
ncbi:MAG TPA: large exoprotein [Microbacterium sp.]|nr:large exoprotein [Microbacterium sp.]